MTSTREGLEEAAQGNSQREGFTPRLVQCRARVLSEFLPRGRVLDLGCGDGLLTRTLAEHHERVVAVEAAPTRVQRTRENCAGLDVEVVHSLLLDYQPEERFTAVVLSCVLQQVEDPASVLEHAYSLLEVGGRIAVIVPHAQSIHRRAGVIMGQLASLDQPGRTCDGLVEERVYDIDLLRTQLIDARFEILDSGGILFKPLPNSMMADMAPEVVDAYEQLGRESPEIAAEIFSVGLRRL